MDNQNNTGPRLKQNASKRGLFHLSIGLHFLKCISCVWVLCPHGCYVCSIHGGQKGVSESLRRKVTGSCELSCECWKPALVLCKGSQWFKCWTVSAAPTLVFCQYRNYLLKDSVWGTARWLSTCWPESDSRASVVGREERESLPKVSPAPMHAIGTCGHSHTHKQVEALSSLYF